MAVYSDIESQIIAGQPIFLFVCACLKARDDESGKPWRILWDCPREQCLHFSTRPSCCCTRKILVSIASRRDSYVFPYFSLNSSGYTNPLHCFFGLVFLLTRRISRDSKPFRSSFRWSLFLHPKPTAMDAISSILPSRP